MEPTTKLTVESTRATNIASPSTEEEDIFVVGDPVISPLTGHLRTVPTTRSKFISGDDISPSKTFDEKGLFSNSVDDEDIDDLFKPKLHSVTTVQKFPNTKSSPRPPRKSSRSSNDMLLPSGEKGV